MSTQAKTILTPEEYLEIERKAPFKSEFYDGEMFAMAGAGWAHNLVVWNVIAELGSQLRGRPCSGFPSDIRVRVTATGLYTYPDVVVVCAKPEFLDERRDTLLNPTLIVEVLSPSTEAYDRGRKFEHYRSIETLREYLLISSDRVLVERYTRQQAGQWLFTSFGNSADAIDLESVGCRVTAAALYDKVDFSAPETR